MKSFLTSCLFFSACLFSVESQTVPGPSPTGESFSVVDPVDAAPVPPVPVPSVPEPEPLPEPVPVPVTVPSTCGSDFIGSCTGSEESSSKVCTSCGSDECCKPVTTCSTFSGSCTGSEESSSKVCTSCGSNECCKPVTTCGNEFTGSCTGSEESSSKVCTSCGSNECCKPVTTCGNEFTGSCTGSKELSSKVCDFCDSDECCEPVTTCGNEFAGSCAGSKEPNTKVCSSCGTDECCVPEPTCSNSHSGNCPTGFEYSTGSCVTCDDDDCCRQTCGNAWPVGCVDMDYGFVCLTSECQHSECCPEHDDEHDTCAGFECPAPTEAYDYDCSDNTDGGVCDEDYCCGGGTDCEIFFAFFGGICPSGYAKDTSNSCNDGLFNCLPSDCCSGTCGNQFPAGSCESIGLEGLDTCAGFECTETECCMEPVIDTCDSSFPSCGGNLVPTGLTCAGATCLESECCVVDECEANFSDEVCLGQNMTPTNRLRCEGPCELAACCEEHQTCSDVFPNGCSGSNIPTDVVTCEHQLCDPGECCVLPGLCEDSFPSCGRSTVPTFATCEGTTCLESECCVDPCEGVICNDRNFLTTDSCDVLTGECVYTCDDPNAGGEDCTCLTGYVLDGVGCDNINECLILGAPTDVCGLNFVCVDSDGSFDCDCPDDYVVDTEGDCVIVEEFLCGDVFPTDLERTQICQNTGLGFDEFETCSTGECNTENCCTNSAEPRSCFDVFGLADGTKGFNDPTGQNPCPRLLNFIGSPVCEELSCIPDVDCCTESGTTCSEQFPLLADGDSGVFPCEGTDTQFVGSSECTVSGCIPQTDCCVIDDTVTCQSTFDGDCGLPGLSFIDGSCTGSDECLVEDCCIPEPGCFYDFADAEGNCPSRPVSFDAVTHSGVGLDYTVTCCLETTCLALGSDITCSPGTTVPPETIACGGFGGLDCSPSNCCTDLDETCGDTFHISGCGVNFVPVDNTCTGVDGECILSDCCEPVDGCFFTAGEASGVCPSSSIEFIDSLYCCQESTCLLQEDELFSCTGDTSVPDDGIACGGVDGIPCDADNCCTELVNVCSSHICSAGWTEDLGAVCQGNCGDADCCFKNTCASEIDCGDDLADKGGDAECISFPDALCTEGTCCISKTCGTHFTQAGMCMFGVEEDSTGCVTCDVTECCSIEISTPSPVTMNFPESEPEPEQFD